VRIKQSRTADKDDSPDRGLSKDLKTPQSKDKKKSYNMLHRDTDFDEFVVAT
jgi:hypothetical protein